MPTPSPTVTPVATSTATATPAAPTPTSTPSPTPTPEIIREDIRATHLTIAAVGIDADVQASVTVPFVYVPQPGCPPGPQDTETLTVPDQGIATPEEDIEGLENKAWIFGHSRWAGVPGVFYTLQDLSLGDEVIVDGVDRESGEPISQERFIVDGFYLADVDSGDSFLTNQDAADIPTKPIVILQTSVRERADLPWILDRDALLAKADNIVEGDIDDPCKYLLLFVTATQG